MFNIVIMYLMEFFSGILGDVLIWLRDNLLKERPELFLQEDSV